MSRTAWERDLRDLTEKLGWAMTLTAKGHWRMSKSGYQDVFTSGTPGDWRVYFNVRAKLRRARPIG
jgi:hypothetical protein